MACLRVYKCHVIVNIILHSVRLQCLKHLKCLKTFSKHSNCIFLADFKAKGQSQGGAAKETDDSSKETQVKMPVTDTPSQGRT